MTILSILTGTSDGPKFDRVRYEPRRRTLTVVRSERVTPAMLRLTLSGPELAGFQNEGFDDHLKVIVPCTGERRDYTPRRFDAAAGTLAIDFAVHEGGAVTDWAVSAVPGDSVEIMGPKGSSIVSSDVRRLLLVGDETALPAIGRCIEDANDGVAITSVAAVTDRNEEQRWATRADLTQRWSYRALTDAADVEPLMTQLRSIDLTADTFVWVAAEANVARSIRDYLVGERGHTRGWVKSAGYWVNGHAGGKERL
jgi:NADPH-dependent ferric siderophore reductase